MNRSHQAMPARRGFMLMTDVFTGMVIVALMSAVLAVAATRERRAEVRLAGQRAAIRLAERALLELQHHRPMPAIVGAEITLRADSTASPVAGVTWVAVRTRVDGEEATLWGTLPAADLPTGGAK